MIDRCNVLLAVVALALPRAAIAQAPSRWPPDSLVNTQVIPCSTPVMQVVGTMRNIAGGLGVRCQFCHVGEEGMLLERFDFASDQKRTKLVARQMLRMVQEINRRLFTLLVDAATAAGADSTIRAYRALRARYYGRDAYDFGEATLNIAALRIGRAARYDDAFALFELNEGLFPGSSALSVFRGNINLMRGDTSAAATAFREALRRDPANDEARGRLRAIGRQP